MEPYNDVYHRYQVVLFDIFDSTGLLTTNAVILDENITSPIPKAMEYSTLDNALIIAWASYSQIF
jgi:hypothetical protein